MPTLHTPERGADESPADYKIRRAQSQSAAAVLESGPVQTPSRLDYALIWRHYWTGQHTNETRAQRRTLKRVVDNRQWRRMVLRAYKLKAEKNART